MQAGAKFKANAIIICSSEDNACIHGSGTDDKVGIGDEWEEESGTPSRPNKNQNRKMITHILHATRTSTDLVQAGDLLVPPRPTLVDPTLYTL